MKNIKYLLLVLLILPACKEDEAPIEYPFRCKVNGVEWIPQIPSGTQWGGANELNLQYYDDIKGISFTAHKNTDDQLVNQSIFFSAKPIQLGENKIKVRLQNFIDWNISAPCGFYDLDTLQPHIINIKSIDKEARKIKGTFYFSVIDQECNEQIDITNGEFNFNY